VNLERLYLDYNATSPLSHSVIDWLKSGDVLFANPASQHSDGKSSRKVVNESRVFIYKTFNKNDKDTKLFFHSGATEGLATFAYSFSEVTRVSHKNLLICYSKIDHPAVTALSERFYGPHVKTFELKRSSDLLYDHEANYQALKKLKESDPDLVILYHHLWVHNETGQVSPLEELMKFKSIPDLYLHIDSVQSPGKIKDWQKLSVGDIWTFSAHKFGALKGIGFSFFNSSLPFQSFISGGGQQSNLRSGTENTQGIKSVALALSDLVKVNVEENSQQRAKLLSFIRSELKDIGEVIDDRLMASNTIYFYLYKLSSDIALALFDINGLEISAGSACSSGAAKASLVLLQKGLDSSAKNGLRFSMGFQISEEDLNKIQDRLRPIFHKLRQV
jgi:cysteine desulfurase